MASASVTSTPSLHTVDAAGSPLDPGSMADGQVFYLDARGVADAGSVTVTAAVAGSSATGLVASVPTVPGGAPTAADHAQSFMVIAPSGTRTIASAAVAWVAAAVTSDLTSTGTTTSESDLPSTSSERNGTSPVSSTTRAALITNADAGQPELAVTGVNTGTWSTVAGALLLIGFGSAMTAWGRRRIPDIH